METAYQVILSLGEEELSSLWCDLSQHKIYHKRKLIFDGNSFCNMNNAAQLNSLRLIDTDDTPWQDTIASLYQQYNTCYPKHVKFSNFIHDKIVDNNYLFAPDIFHTCRLALELYIIFHYAQKDLIWPDNSKFMLPVCHHCVIKRCWIA